MFQSFLDIFLFYIMKWLYVSETDLIQDGKINNQFDREVQNSKKQKIDRNKPGKKTSGDTNGGDLVNDDSKEEFDMWGRR